MPILQQLDNLLVNGQDAMLYNRISKKVELLARIAYKSTSHVKVAVPNNAKHLIDNLLEGQTHITYPTRSTEIRSQLRGICDEIPQLFTMTSNVENEELRNVLLTDISDLQVSVKNALKRIP
jgi:hypothetical protein